MELLQLDYFKEVARLEHVTDAARSLHVTQSSLSRTIARLEQDLGVPLFDRVGRKVRLNNYGRVFLERVDKALFELEQGRRAVADLAGADYGAVSLGVNTALMLPDVLRKFRRQRPHVQFHVQQLPPDAMHARLEQGALDFCLSAPPITGRDIVCEPVLTEAIYVIVPPSHRLAERRSIGLAELQDEAFVGLKKGYGMRDLMDHYCQLAGFVPRHTFEGDEPTTLRALVRGELGVAFVPDTSRNHGTGEDGVYLRIEPECKRITGLSWRKDRYLSVAAQEFRQTVMVCYQKAVQP
ncbi:MAG: LysR family transcriptional regulator [Bacilli bacterium]